MSEPAATLNRDILYLEDVAKLTGKSIATLRWLRATGSGPRSGKLGRRVVYRRADVDAWVSEAFK